jgi:alpha-L-arabinofuranosidase
LATLDPPSGQASVFLVNRAPSEPVDLGLSVAGLGPSQLIEHVVLADEDPYARNSRASPERVMPRHVAPRPLEDGRLSVSLPPVSWTMLRLEPDGQ